MENCYLRELIEEVKQQADKEATSTKFMLCEDKQPSPECISQILEEPNISTDILISRKDVMI